MTLWSTVKNELAGLFDLLLPPACAFCGQVLTEPSDLGICSACLAQLPSLPPSHCPRCALPYVAENGSGHLCENCLRKPPPYEQAIALGLYQGLLREGIQRFKFNQAVDLDRALGLLLATRLEQKLPDWRPELILPVPLYRQRLRQRGYNQSLLLARRIGRHWHIPVAARCLLRTRHTPPQQGLPLSLRQQNLRGAFALKAPLGGETVLLIDDVMTTGATVNACAQTLKQGGAGRIFVAVAGRAARHF